MGYYLTKRKGKSIIGKMILLLQLIISAGFAALLWKSGMIPGKFLLIAVIVLLALLGVTFILLGEAFGFQFSGAKGNIVGAAVSILSGLIMGIGIIYLAKADAVLKNVGGATYKTDNMIVVVKNEDPAKKIEDAKNYRFGIQTVLDQDNNALMVKDIEDKVGREIKLIENETIIDEAKALLSGRIEAAIYNEAYGSVIEEAVEGYSDQVRVLYQYGIETEIETEETNIEKAFNIYISGIDVAGSISTNSRSDVNIIMTVNPATKKILLTTTPRDYYVQIPGVSGEARDKLTHAGIYGVDRSMATLENIYDIDISYFARVNFTSLITIVDALGGVNVESEYEFEAGGYSFKKGMNHLNGEQALAFARERYSFKDGDNQRGKNQEAILKAILERIMFPDILFQANEILDNVADCVETNMTRDEMVKFINMQLSERAAWEIETTAATGSGDKQACFSSGSQLLYVMWPDEAVVSDISRKMKKIEGENEG
ncbi:polyisoprenyl-teichoic acid--peptidoglycan teichoic acid transferase TagU [Lachnospiraceae bacterium]|nr:polyisoprenyl-teichoic acid--peptidoglycan teichoic acid transferase TagU [Lachnospiraceae bacterium]